MMSKSLISTGKPKPKAQNSQKIKGSSYIMLNFNSSLVILFTAAILLTIMVPESDCRKVSGYSKMSHRKTNAQNKECPKGYTRNSLGKCEKISFVIAPPVVISPQQPQKPNRVFHVQHPHQHRRVYNRRPQRFAGYNNNNFNPFIQRLVQLKHQLVSG